MFNKHEIQRCELQAANSIKNKQSKQEWSFGCKNSSENLNLRPASFIPGHSEFSSTHKLRKF